MLLVSQICVVALIIYSDSLYLAHISSVIVVRRLFTFINFMITERKSVALPTPPPPPCED